MNFKLLAEDVAEVIKKAVILNFKIQDHVMTGNLIDTIKYEIEATDFNAKIDFLLNDYGMVQNYGITPARIPYSPGSGKKTSKYIEGLKRFATIKLKAQNDKEALSIAFAIAKKHKLEGMPSNGSKLMGKKTGAIDDALKDSNQEVTNLIDKALEEYVNLKFVSAFSKINKKSA